MEMPKAKVCIIGAGLAGSMLAALFSKLGFSVDLFEKRDPPKLSEDVTFYQFDCLKSNSCNIF